MGAGAGTENKGEAIVRERGRSDGGTRGGVRGGVRNGTEKEIDVRRKK